MKHWNSVFRQLSMLSQMGLSLMMPLLLCLLGSYWLNTRFHVGSWIYLPGFFFGLGGSFATAYKIYQSIMKETERKNEKRCPSYNRHH